jgi:hypothetical protein
MKFAISCGHILDTSKPIVGGVSDVPTFNFCFHDIHASATTSGTTCHPIGG